MFRQAFGAQARVGILDSDYVVPQAYSGLVGYSIGSGGQDDATLLLVQVSTSDRVMVTVVPREFGAEFARATGIWVETHETVTTEIDAKADQPEAVAALTERLLARHVADIVMEGGYSLERTRPSVGQRLGISRNPDLGEDTAFTRKVAAEVGSLETKAESARRAAELAATEAARKQAGDRDVFLGSCPGLAAALAALGRDIQASDEAAVWIGDAASDGINLVLVPSRERDGTGKFLMATSRVENPGDARSWIEVGVDKSGHVDVAVGDPSDQARTQFMIGDGARYPAKVVEAIEIAVANCVAGHVVRYT